MEDKYIGEDVYRIVGWDQYPRQSFPYHVIKSKFDKGDWLEECGFETYEEAENYINKKGVKK